jgi:hypothetical protein
LVSATHTCARLLYPSLRCCLRARKESIFLRHRRPDFPCRHALAARSRRTMPQLSAQRKHDILLRCESRRADQSDVDVAGLCGVTASRQTIWRWRSRWNHTPQSLEHAPVLGRPRTLTPSEVSRHVRAPILAANRAHRAISYTKLLPEVRRKTGKPIALRTLQEIGKQQLDAQAKATRKRTRQEGDCTGMCVSARLPLVCAG